MAAITQSQVSAIQKMINLLEKSKPTEDQIFTMFGTALPTLGVKVAPRNSKTFLVTEKNMNTKTLSHTLDLITNGNVINTNAALVLGRSFWQTLYERIKRAICSSRQFIDAVSRRLSSSLAALIRFIANLLGISLSVTAMSVIAAIIYNMIRLGVNRFCGI